jgi:hypothetical protein
MTPSNLAGKHEPISGTYCNHLQPCSQIPSTLKMEAVWSSEALLPTYQTSRYHNSEDHIV